MLSERVPYLGRPLAGLAVLLAVCSALSVISSRSSAQSAWPVDAPKSNEPRVVAAKCLSSPGLLSSPGAFSPFVRVQKDDSVYSRDVLVAIPGFKVDVQPVSGNVLLTLWGNLPGLSDSPVLESSVILHDSRAFDLDFTMLAGRIVLTNSRKKGPAKIWLRAQAGVQLTLPEPGDSVALEGYGRWPRGVPFSLKPKADDRPILLWEIHCLKGTLEIKAGRNEWYMSAPPGAAYFHGDSVHGPEPDGPEKRSQLPSWADPKAPEPELAKIIDQVVKAYAAKLKATEPTDIGKELLAAADKEKDPRRGKVIRQLVVHAMAALDSVDRVVGLLEKSNHPEMRQAAVVGLRHWIGAREGRDMILYKILTDQLDYSKTHAEAIMQLLHSPFNPNEPETYETLILALRHPKQAVRELAHWHLVRLAPIGRDIPYDAGAPAAERNKAASTWAERIPEGTLPKEKTDDTKKEKKK